MKDLKQEFQKETNLSFEDIPINGVHIEYINWLEKRIEALSLHNVVGRSEQLICPICGLDGFEDQVDLDIHLEDCED